MLGIERIFFGLDYCMSASAEVRIPSLLLDLHGSYYRSFVAEAQDFTGATTSSQRMADSVFGIGFMQKSGAEANTHDNDPMHYSAIYLLSGRGTYRDDTGFTAELMPGSVFQRLPGRKHTALFNPTVRYVEIFLAFSTWLLDPLARVMSLVQRPVVQLGLDLALIRDLAAAHEALLTVRETELPRVYLYHLGLLTSLCTGAHQASASSLGMDDAWIDEACRLLADEATGRAPLERIAKRLNLSYEVFRKEFRIRMGISPGDYRIRRRLDRARELLISTRATITDIADDLGYPNASVFSLQFKRLVGWSPEHYRRRSGS